MPTRILMRTVSAALFCTLSTLSPAASQEPVFLSCEGSFNSAGPITAPISVSIEVRLDLRQVEANFGVASLTVWNSRSYGFRGPLIENGAATGSFEGHIDRLSGKASVYAMRASEPGRLAWVYELTCLPARQLF